LAKIVFNDKGQSIVRIDNVLFKGKRKIDWQGVERYLKKYIGEKYKSEAINEDIYVGSEFPDEFANSKYSHNIFGTIGKAKANASQAIPELISTISNVSFQDNMDEKHKINAKYGWYRGTVRFTLPICNDKGVVTGENLFQGRVIIRCGADGKKYIYDIIDIKKET
jgi:hypothetical protein